LYKGLLIVPLEAEERKKEKNDSLEAFISATK
jgi:hypothetical protein